MTTEEKILSNKIGKFLFEKHEHPGEDGELGIYYSENSVLELLELLNIPKPNFNWFEAK